MARRRERYNGEKLYSPDYVSAIILKWLINQRKTEGIYLPGSLTPMTMIYAHRDEGGATEPAVHYQGEVSPEYNANVKDEDILLTLKDLADLLAAALGQNRIYVRYVKHEGAL